MERKKGPSFRTHWTVRPKMRIRTTMFDLIKALNEEVKAGEEALVPRIVRHMIDSGLLKFTGYPNASK